MGDYGDYDEYDDHVFYVNGNYVPRPRKFRPIQQNELTEQLQKEDPLVPLANPSSAVGIEIDGPRKAPVYIQLSGRLIPSLAPQKSSKLRLSFRVCGGRVAKRICPDAKVAGANTKSNHTKKLEFFPGLGHVNNFQCSLAPSRSGVEADSSLWWNVSWETFGGIGTGLDAVLADFDQETAEGLQALSCLQLNLQEPLSSRQSLRGKATCIRLRV